jgi:hypothetical protein
MMTTQQLNEQLKEEAHVLLYGQGLHPILQSYGEVHHAGSYALDLMTWRDLDIFLEVEDLSLLPFFELGGRINEALQPVKMNFRNELAGGTTGLPYGLYWGICLGNESAGAWKIDIWAVESPECSRLLEYGDRLSEQLTEEARPAILEIKAACRKDPGYRRSYHSGDIYSAVLDHGIRNTKAFYHYLSEKASI